MPGCCGETPPRPLTPSGQEKGGGLLVELRKGRSSLKPGKQPAPSLLGAEADFCPGRGSETREAQVPGLEPSTLDADGAGGAEGLRKCPCWAKARAQRKHTCTRPAHPPHTLYHRHTYITHTHNVHRHTRTTHGHAHSQTPGLAGSLPRGPTPQALQRVRISQEVPQGPERSRVKGRGAGGGSRQWPGALRTRLSPGLIRGQSTVKWKDPRRRRTHMANIYFQKSSLLFADPDMGQALGGCGAEMPLIR